MPGITVKVKRTKKGNDTVVAFSYTNLDNPTSTTTFVADGSTDEFDMTPEQAIAAVETGGFAVSEDSKSPTQKTQPLTPADK